MKKRREVEKGVKEKKERERQGKEREGKRKFKYCKFLTQSY